MSNFKAPYVSDTSVTKLSLCSVIATLCSCFITFILGCICSSVAVRFAWDMCLRHVAQPKTKRRQKHGDIEEMLNDRAGGGRKHPPPSSVGFRIDRAGGGKKFQNLGISKENLQILRSPPPPSSIEITTHRAGGGVLPPPPSSSI
jgi:hypothetical protein